MRGDLGLRGDPGEKGDRGPLGKAGRKGDIGDEGEGEVNIVQPENLTGVGSAWLRMLQFCHSRGRKKAVKKARRYNYESDHGALHNLCSCVAQH